jgi:hypothetical protein
MNAAQIVPNEFDRVKAIEGQPVLRRTWHKRTVRRLLAGVAAGAILAGAAMHTIAPAHADSDLTHVQIAYIQAYGAGAICPVLDSHHTIPGVVGVMKGVMQDGFTAGEAVAVVNAAVATYCDRNWPLLQSVGAYFRAQAPVQEQIL